MVGRAPAEEVDQHKQHKPGEQSRAEQRNTRKTSCLGRAAVPVKRVWRGLSARLRLRRATGKSSSSSSCYYMAVDRGSSACDGDADGADAAAAAAGLGRLRKEVRTCEYSDVHVMWEMLSSSSKSVMAGADASAGGGKGSRRRIRVGRKAAVSWNRLASYCCAL